ncbi:DUF4300 family protein [Moraxella sp. FZFQ2102]|uniref:DUF4300 family protein n=1 Tax=Moraxella sp. FZFQ2102 TaxID=2953752 RepID=UPI00209BFEE7|nr:DUF4300 family protein [Moraxella sp. FZFQ2102]USZ14231.1 DUF4300 family protein [Moraxella sp. FZFQ2102]
MSNKFPPVLLAISTAVALSACSLADNGNNNHANKSVNQPSTQTQSTPAAQADSAPLFSNLADDDSRKQVQEILQKHLNKSDVDTVMTWAADYNHTINNTNLTQGFSTAVPSYDAAAIDELWAKSKGDFIGTNCRINTFSLLKDNIQISGADTANDQMLFMDHDAITTGKLLSSDELSKFNRLFAKVKTEPTKNVQVHAKKMQAHFVGIQFDDNATMLSVVFHDDIDGDYLFIGHVGVLVPSNTSHLFIEKLSFQEPYQAVKFADKNTAYAYLLDKYAVDFNQPTAQPFIMENDKLVKWADEKPTAAS